MEKIKDGPGKKRGFTIVELLTVMSIIVILISILVPALNKVRRFALDVKQRAQLHAIGTGLEAFSAELDGYPDSNQFDSTYPTTQFAYCGAMKLAEAMVGQDLKGFNPDSKFEKKGFMEYLPIITPWCINPATCDCMPYPPADYPSAACYTENLKKRKTYLQLENANAYQIKDIWIVSDITATSTFEPNAFVLCDVYSKVTNRTTGRKMGMPILYFKADPTKTRHPADGISFQAFNSNAVTNPSTSIYDVIDNLDLVNLPLPWDTGSYHPMANWMPASPGGAMIFYQKIRNKKVSDPWPYRADTFILMSAGYDGLYGTGDDIFNFSE